MSARGKFEDERNNQHSSERVSFATSTTTHVIRAKCRKGCEIEVLEIIHIKQIFVVVKRIYLTLVSASATWSWLLYRCNKPVELDSYAFIITLI